MPERQSIQFGILLLRLTVGSLFVAHLYWKFFLLDGGVAAWWGLLEKAGYPAIVPLYSMTAEVVGATLITAGLYTRWASLYAIPFMLGAAYFWIVRKGFYFTDAGAELPIVWAIMLATQALLGDGVYSFAAIRNRQP